MEKPLSHAANHEKRCMPQYACAACQKKDSQKKYINLKCAPTCVVRKERRKSEKVERQINPRK